MIGGVRLNITLIVSILIMLRLHVVIMYVLSVQAQ